MSKNLPYLQVLREIDKLREQGIADSDPQMMKLRMQLRDHLEELNKNKPKKSVVPTLMAVKTVKFEQPRQDKKPAILAKSVIQPKSKNKIVDIRDLHRSAKTTTLGETSKDHLARYALLGAAIAIAALAYKWYRENYQT